MKVQVNNRVISILVMLFVVAGFSACSRLASTAPEDVDNVTIAASIQLPHKNFNWQTLTKMVLQVTGSNTDTIRSELTLSAGGASGKVEVPVGKLLTFTVTGYQDQIPVLSGSTQFKPEAGKDNKINISLNFLQTALILTPADSSVNVGDQLTLFLQVRHCTDLGTIGARILFDNTKLKVVDLGREDDFLKSQSGSVNQLEFTKDNTNGTVDIVLSVFPASAAVSGDGKIGRIVFQALSAGTANLSVSVDNTVDSDLGLYDKNAQLIQAFALGSRITIK